MYIKTTQGTAAIVGIRALKDNTRRSIKRMVSVSQPDKGATAAAAEATNGANLDVMVNSSAGHDFAVRESSVTTLPGFLCNVATLSGFCVMLRNSLVVGIIGMCYDVYTRSMLTTDMCTLGKHVLLSASH